MKRKSFGRDVLDKEQDTIGERNVESSRHSALFSDIPTFAMFNDQLEMGREAHAGRHTFARLLQMLQQEHERELNSIRIDLECKLQAVQKEVLDERSARIETCSGSAASTSSEQMECYVPARQKKNTQRASTKSNVSRKSFVSNFWSQSNIPRAFARNSAEGEISIAPTPWEGECESEYARQHRVTEFAAIRQFVSDHAPSPHALTYDDSRLPAWRQKMIEFTTWQSFDIWCVFVIISNSVIIGVQIDYTSRRGLSPLDAPTFFRTVDRIYTSMFFVELMIRIVAYGRSFFYRHGWAWNVFDFIVVASDSCQTVVELVVVQEGGGNAVGNFTALRMLRALRLTRAIRVIRLIRFFRELRMMVYSIMLCGKSLMWSLLMFFAIIYIFSFFLMNAVGLYVYENRNDRYYGHYKSYWTTLPEGMWTLFICMTGGVSWNEIGGPLTHIGWIYGGTLGFFMFFTIFVVTNIITGIFVDTALRSAQNDRAEVIAEQLHDRDSARMELQAVFEQADRDASGTVSYDELREHLEDEKVRAHLRSIGLQIDEARALFVLLDMDNSGEIEIEEFLFGCMRLKGSATSVNLAQLMYENKRLIEGFKRFHNDVIYSLEVIHGKVEQAQREMMQPVKSDLIALKDEVAALRKENKPVRAPRKMAML